MRLNLIAWSVVIHVGLFIAVPSFAQSDALMNSYSVVVPVAPMCQFLKYSVDGQRLANNADQYAEQLNDTDPLSVIAGHKMLVAGIAEIEREIAVFSEPDLNQMLQKLEPVFRRRNDQCLRISKSDKFSSYFRPSEFSQSGEEQSAKNWIEFYADRGDPFAMGLKAEMYLTGEGGYPVDRKKAFEFLEKSAGAGDGFSMTMVCEAQIKGIDMPKDRVSAAKWCYLAKTIDPKLAKSVAADEKRLTLAEKAAGKKAGDKWIADQ